MFQKGRKKGNSKDEYIGERKGVPGTKSKGSPTETVPLRIPPTTTVPTPPILYFL